MAGLGRPCARVTRRVSDLRGDAFFMLDSMKLKIKIVLLAAAFAGLALSMLLGVPAAVALGGATLLVLIGLGVPLARAVLRRLAGGAQTPKGRAHALGEADPNSAMAAPLEPTSVSIEHLAHARHDPEDGAASADGGAQSVAAAADEMHRIAGAVSAAAEMIRTLELRTNEISSIAWVIKEIAAQTDLLALNAAIESARAGEHGRSFAVVADEVRKLAERTSTATGEIADLIGAIRSDTASAGGAMGPALPQVERGAEPAQQAAGSLREIRDGAGVTLARIREVALAAREQRAAGDAIARQLESIAQLVEQTSASMQHTAESARSLEQIAHELGALVARFKH